MGLIYKITNTANSKVYLGKTIRPFKNRIKEHLKDYKIKDNKLYRAMRKYGTNFFVFEILEDNIQAESLGAKEKYYIKLYDSYYNGYNSTFGGEGESCVDEQEIINLFLQGYNCTDISIKTSHTIKTVSSVLKRNGYKISQHLGKNSNGKNWTEIGVIYLNNYYDSLTDLANFLKMTEDTFKDKRIPTIVQGISRSLKNNSSYFGRKFEYS